MCEFTKTVYKTCFKSIKSFLKFKCLLVAVSITTVLLPIMAAIPVSANPGLSVIGSLIVANVTPGQTLTRTITMSIGSSDPATDLSVQVDGAAQSPQGTYMLLDAAHDTGQYSARTFITVDKSSIHLDPGGSQTVTATIQVPQDVGTGGRFAIINFSSQPVTGAQGVGIITAVDVPVYLTIQGSQLTQTGKITGVTAGTITNGQPVNITTTFQNTGNIYYKVEGEITVANDQGTTLGTIPIPLTNSSIIPGMSRDLTTSFVPSGELAAGTYNISSKVMLADGSVLDQSTSTFTVKGSYVPPAAIGQINLAPSSASTLKNTDGTISIYFPTGAAAIPVDISLNNYDASQLPVAPTGFTFTGSSFQVNGLTGLLAKDATVTVKYTATDLSKANGKATSLKLLRWDPGNNQWVVLKTKVDASAMTLSASSNQMGIWAVAAGTATSSSGTNWTMISIIAVVIVVIGVVVVLLVARRKPKGKATKS